MLIANNCGKTYSQVIAGIIITIFNYNSSLSKIILQLV